MKIYNSDHKMFFELTDNLINKEKWKKFDVDASEFQNFLSLLMFNIKMESRNQE